MRVRFPDPQDGQFLVGSSVGAFLFRHGYHDSVPDAIFQEWKNAGLSLVPVDDVDPVTENEPDEDPAVKARPDDDAAHLEAEKTPTGRQSASTKSKARSTR